MSVFPLNVVILAAGQGKRMQSKRPKVLHPLAGRPLLRHVIDTARQLAPARICVVHGHGGDQVRAAIPDPDLAWALQAEQLGTGHAVAQALPALDAGGLALILYGDVPLVAVACLRDLIAAAAGGRVALLTTLLADAAGYGRIVRDSGGRVQRIVEHKDANEAERAIREVNTGILAAPVALLGGWLARLRNDNAQGEYYLTDIIAMAAADGVAVEALTTGDEWTVAGVNSREQLAALERHYQLAEARRLMAGGATLADPARIDVRGTLQCGRDVTIDIGCVFEGRVEIGDDVSIGAHCVIRDAVLAPGARIEPHSVIEGARIGPDCRVGPFARLRPGAVLDGDNHIGNFVEVKNSRIGVGSKANHLTYIGDSAVGRSVNVGAGTITCNYDGVNKHRTVIADGAFIGSGTMLVAPVTVEAGATIGAGSTVTRTAPADALTVARARQVTLPGWKRPVKKSGDPVKKSEDPVKKSGDPVKKSGE